MAAASAASPDGHEAAFLDGFADAARRLEPDESGGLPCREIAGRAVALRGTRVGSLCGEPSCWRFWWWVRSRFAHDRRRVASRSRSWSARSSARPARGANRRRHGLRSTEDAALDAVARERALHLGFEDGSGLLRRGAARGDGSVHDAGDRDLVVVRDVVQERAHDVPRFRTALVVRSPRRDRFLERALGETQHEKRALLEHDLGVKPCCRLRAIGELLHAFCELRHFLGVAHRTQRTARCAKLHVGAPELLHGVAHRVDPRAHRQPLGRNDVERAHR